MSNRWGVRVNKKGDAYVYCRDERDSEKVSLHASGRQHISVTSETAARVGSGSRFGNVWKAPEFDTEAIATFSIVFPPWGVGIPFSLNPRGKDELLIVGHREKLVVVSFFIVDSEKVMRGRMPHFVVGQLPLGPRRTLHIITWKEPQRDLMEQIRSAFPQVSRSIAHLELTEDQYTLSLQGYRGTDSAYIVTVPVRYKPPT